MSRDAMCWVRHMRTIIRMSIILLTCFGVTSVAESADAVKIDLEINDTATPDDDYFCWTPVPARVRLADGDWPRSVVLSSRTTGTGAVVFQKDRGKRPTSEDFAPKASITVPLAKDGRWTRFWVAGSQASTNGKDTRVTASTVEGMDLVSTSLMVRVRKDASMLTQHERERLLDALRVLHDIDNIKHGLSEYMKHAKAHADASHFGIHGSGSPNQPLFLAWHRALLLTLEREFQEIDPTVAIPYWRFDRSIDDPRTQRIFSRYFMGTVPSVLSGSVDPHDQPVQFDRSNPLHDWV